MITVPTREREQVRPWKRVLETASVPDFNWVEPDGQVHMEASGIGGRATVHTPAAEAIFAGAARTLTSVLDEADGEGGRPRGFMLATQAKMEVRGKAERVTSANVIALLPGSDPSLAAQHVVLSAHLDHLGVNDLDPAAPDKDRINNGALDNAAGIATMLEVARAVAAAPVKPRRSIIFLASTAEEEGLLGADYFARHPTVPIGQIVGNVDLDMPVLLYSFTDVVAFGANHSSLGPLVAKAAGSMDISLAPDPSPEEGIFTRSDHYMFVKQGVPAVFLATGRANGGEKAWDQFLAGAYHHPDDDLKQPIDWQAGARFAEVNYRITREMADADEPPLWNDRDFFGDTFAPKAPRHKQK
jgi:Zn-dependent M28 family amino/carboxypeptidase